MEKFKIGIIALCLIFLVGGCYAVFNGNDLTNNAAADISSSSNAPSNDVNNQVNNLQNDNSNAAKDISQNKNINNVASALENTYRKIPGADILVNKDIDYTDMYIHCVVCGGFIPLGEVTKALPEDALCPDLCGGHTISDNTDYTVTYEFAKEFYDQYGRHPEEIAEETTPEEIPHADVPVSSDEPISVYPISVYDMNNPNEQY